MDLLMSTKKNMAEMVTEKLHLKEINLQAAEDVAAETTAMVIEILSHLKFHVIFELPS